MTVGILSAATADEQPVPTSLLRRDTAQSREEIAAALPPHDLDVERALLGAVLLEGRATLLRVREVLGPADFYPEGHRTIYGAMLRLAERGEPVDLLTVQHELAQADELAGAGGPAALALLVEQASIAVHLDAYMQIVKELSIKRDVIQRATQLVTQAFNGTGPTKLLTGLEAARAAVADSLGLIAPLAPSLGEVLGATLDAFRHGATAVVPVPWSGLADLLGGGLHAGEYVILGSRPGLGKTVLAGLLAIHAGRLGVATLVISLEMALQAFGRRVFAQQAHISATALRRGDLDEFELDKLAECLGHLRALPCYFDQEAVTLRRIEAAIRRHVERRQVRLVIIDYLQLVGVPKARDTRERVETVSRTFKTLAHEHGLVLVALCSLARTPDGKGGEREPVLSDLRESGQLEHDADWVWLLHRPPKAKRTDHDDPTRLVLKVAKGRDGATGRLELVFTPPILTLEERDTDREEVPF